MRRNTVYICVPPKTLAGYKQKCYAPSEQRTNNWNPELLLGCFLHETPQVSISASYEKLGITMHNNKPYAAARGLQPPLRMH